MKTGTFSDQTAKVINSERETNCFHTILQLELPCFMLSLFSWPNRLGQWNKLPCYMRRDSTQMFRYYFQLFGRIFNVITNVISTNDRISEKKNGVGILKMKQQTFIIECSQK